MTRFSIGTVPFLCMTLLGCNAEQSAEDQPEIIPIAEETDDGLALPDLRMIPCQVSAFNGRSRVELALPTRTSRQLIAITPDERQMLVSYPRTRGLPNAPVDPRSLKFGSDNLIYFENLNGVDLTNAGAIQPVFLGEGEYTFILTDNYEVDMPLIDGWCRVSFSPD